MMSSYEKFETHFYCIPEKYILYDGLSLGRADLYLAVAVIDLDAEFMEFLCFLELCKKEMKNSQKLTDQSHLDSMVDGYGEFWGSAWPHVLSKRMVLSRKSENMFKSNVFLPWVF